MRATSTFSFEEGRSTRGCFAIAALRIRVSRSAMGSVCIRPYLFSYLRFEKLPACLHHAGDFSLERVAAETNAAHIELAEVATRAAADPAAVAFADLELQLPLHLCKLCSAAHSPSLSLLPLRAERHAELLQKFAALFVVCGRGCDGDVHALDFVHARVINFREHELVFEAECVIAAAVERVWRQALEITH